jgi:signal transduction histidine kinase/HPt (histidine-containing phosphotransfer) domain-containing protein
MEKILIVDDDECILDATSCILESHYATHSCSRGAEAIAWATAHQPDLILLDVLMDEMDGYDVCRELKNRPETRDIPVIFVSSLDSVQDETHGLSLGAIDYLAKPLNASIALARIANHLKLKRHEDELRQLNHNMEELVRQRTAQLSRALEAAKIADRAKDEFLANISHELRTPLSAVIGFSSLAIPFSTDARQREYLEKVTRSGRALSAIINDLLDLSKIAAGCMTLEIAPFSLRELIARSRSTVAYEAEAKGLELSTQIDESAPDVLIGDSLRLEQILLNLLSNAVKFTAAGRIALHVGLLRRQGERICLSIDINDTGIGLRTEDIALLFKPFSQTDASITRKVGGTGLGLSICKRLTEMMDGEITASSAEGCGTTFHIKLWFGLGKPEDLLANALNTRAKELPAYYHEANVLVVDDQLFNREVAEGLLAVVGITPRMVANGQEALNLLLEAGPAAFDLVLMDIRMPVMDGLSATRELRSRPGFGELPIVAMTAHTMPHEKAQSATAGMNDQLGKPFDDASFYRVLAKWIPLAKQQAQAAASALPLSVPDTGLPTLPGIDTRAGLSLFVGDEVRYRHWLTNFIDEAPALLAQIRQALAAGQIDEAGIAAHTLKGRSGMLGMGDLNTMAARVEAAVDGGEPAETLIDHLERGVGLMCKEIGKAFKLGENLPK